MDINLHNESIKKLTNKEKELKAQFSKIGTIILLCSIVVELLVIVISRWFTFAILISSIVILSFDLIFMVIYCEKKKTNFYFKEINKLVIEILRYETNFDITSKEDQKEYISDIKSTRFQDGDFINLNGAFDFNDGGISGTLFNVILSRSNGKTSYTTFSGVMVTFNVETKLDTQIRNDMYAPFKLKKDRSESSREVRVYLPRKSAGKYQKIVLECFNDLLKAFDVKSVGIDFRGNTGSFYVNYYTKMIKLNNISKDSIVALCKLYIDCLNMAVNIKNKIEGDF